MKKYLLYIVLGLLAGYTFIFFFTWCFHPSQVVWIRLMEASEKWERQIRHSNEPCCILVGGSEISFSVNPEHIFKETGLRLVNASTGASSGLLCNTEMAMRFIKPGDTVILSIIHINNSSISPTTHGLQLTLKKRGIHSFTNRLIPFSANNISIALRGDSASYATYLASLIYPEKATYAYQRKEAQLQPSGWIQLSYEKMDKATWLLFPLSALTNHLGDYHRNFKETSHQHFLDIKEVVNRKGAKLCAHMPVWLAHESMRALHAWKALQLTRLGIPVLKDERLGVCSDPTQFADSSLHLKPHAVKENSLIIAKAIQNQSYWTEQELLHILHELGWNEDGSLHTN